MINELGIFAQLDYPCPPQDLIEALKSTLEDAQADESNFSSELYREALGISGIIQTQDAQQKNVFVVAHSGKPYIQGVSLERTLAAVAIAQCREQRAAMVLRGSFDELRTQHVMIDPGQWMEGGSEAALLWVVGWSLRLNSTVLVPADWVYTDLNHAYSKTVRVAAAPLAVFECAPTNSSVMLRALQSLRKTVGIVPRVTSEAPKSLLSELIDPTFADVLFVNLSRYERPFKVAAAFLISG